VRAAILKRAGDALVHEERPDPHPGPGEVLLRVRACGVCRTDLHIRDGELTGAKLPLVLGHQIVGEVVGRGENAPRYRIGERVGSTWLAWADGRCRFCRSGRENLCPHARFTGYDRDGGYAELAVADESFCVPLPEGYDDVHLAPLLCAGAIGFRALRMARDAEDLGLYGFGSSAHIVAQLARQQGQRTFAFTRAGDEDAQRAARDLGAEWAGASGELPPRPLDAAIVFAPVGELVPIALRALAPGGVVVCAGIHMTDVPSFRYSLLWEERQIRSVANVTRADATGLLEHAAAHPLRVRAEAMPLDRAEEALERVRSGHVTGSLVLVPRSA
jgi:propanol-preferring alcohol dehydrogenase